jgi:hypothetical protein
VGYGRGVAEPTAWIAEDVDYDYDLGGWAFTGTFDASVQTDEEILEEADGVSLDDALAWARARSPRVMIRYGYSGYFSAGEESVPDAPPWPPPDLPEFVRRRTPDEGWKDRTDADPSIAWRVVASLRPPGSAAAGRRPEDVRLVTDLAVTTGADDWDGHLIDHFARAAAAATGQTVYTEIPAYRLHYSVRASTPARAADDVRRQLGAPAGWELSISAEPA